MSEDPVVVVGAGIVGSWAFRLLAETGRQVVMIDRSDVGSGATAISTGVVRCFHSDLLLSTRAIAGWEDFRALAADEDVAFRECGVLYLLGSTDGDRARMEIQRLKGRVGVEWLDRRALEDRFGTQFREMPDGAVWEPRAGYVDGGQAVRALVRLGQAAGGELRTGTEAIGISRKGARVVGVVTESGVIPASAVVVAVGAATPRLLDSVPIPHRLLARRLQVDLIRLAGRTSEDMHPVCIDAVHGSYGLQDAEGGDVYVGHQVTARHAGAPSFAHDGARSLWWASRRFPWGRECSYVSSMRASECFGPGEWFWAPRGGDCRIAVAAGFNGGGFKVAPWVARELIRRIGFEIGGLG